MITSNRHAAVRDLDATDRRHAAAAQRHITPFLTAKEAGLEWGEATAKLSARYESIAATLDEPRPGQDKAHLVSTAWLNFTCLTKRLGKKVKASNFDTRPRKPAWNTAISEASRLHAARRTVMSAYEAAGRRASHSIARLPQAARLPNHDMMSTLRRRHPHSSKTWLMWRQPGASGMPVCRPPTPTRPSPPKSAERAPSSWSIALVSRRQQPRRTGQPIQVSGALHTPTPSVRIAVTPRLQQAHLVQTRTTQQAPPYGSRT